MTTSIDGIMNLASHELLPRESCRSVNYSDAVDRVVELCLAHPLTEEPSLDAPSRRPTPRPLRRILIVSHEYPPSPGAGGNRWATMARYLCDQGHSVTVIASDAWGRLPSDEECGVI